MERWIGSNGITKKTSEKDLSGTSFNERSKTDTRNLDDLIRYLEYSGQAARVDIEQEHHWALLLRDLLIRDTITIKTLTEEGYSSFQCNKCGKYMEYRWYPHSDSFEIIDPCEHIENRECDLIEFFERKKKEVQKEKFME